MICLSDLLLDCCSVPTLLVFLAVPYSYICPEILFDPLQTSVSITHFFPPRPILPAAYPRPPGSSGSHHSGQSIDRLMAAGLGVSLLKTLIALGILYIPSPRHAGPREKWGTSDHRIGTPRLENGCEHTQLYVPCAVRRRSSVSIIRLAFPKSRKLSLCLRRWGEVSELWSKLWQLLAVQGISVGG
jgi:hypothetical protein